MGLGSLPVSWSSPWLGRDSRCTALLVCRAGQGSLQGSSGLWQGCTADTVGQQARPSGTAGRPVQCPTRHPATPWALPPTRSLVCMPPHGSQLCHCVGIFECFSVPFFHFTIGTVVSAHAYGITGLLGYLHSCFCIFLPGVVTVQFLLS